MTELIVVLLICVAWAITSIIIKLIERRCKHEWEAVRELPCRVTTAIFQSHTCMSFGARSVGTSVSAK